MAKGWIMNFTMYMRSLISISVIVVASQSTALEITMRIDPNLSTSHKRFAVEAVRVASVNYEKLFGYEFDPRTRVYVSAEPSYLAKEYVKFRGGNYSQKLRAFKKHIVGEASYQSIFVNTSHPNYNRKSDTTLKGNRQRMWNHEFFHIMQYELIGSKAKSCCQPNSTKPVGPIWMMEGLASYYARRMERRGLQNYLNHCRRQFGNLKGASLKALETRNGMNKVQSSYEISAYAAHRLVERAGDAAVVRFYQGLRRTSNWKKVFADSFGVTPEDFYASLR